MAKTAKQLVIEKLCKQSYCIDVPDSRDYPYQERVAFKEIAQGDTPNYVWDESKVTIQDQGNVGMCTRAAITQLSNAFNIKEYGDAGVPFTELKIEDVWNRSNKQLRLTSALKQFKDEGLIAGYTSIPNTMTIEHQNNLIKHALDTGGLIYSGSLNCNRGKTGKTLQFTYDPERVNGHAHGIAKPVPYNNSYGYRYKCPNTRGPDRGDKGYFYTDPKDIGHRYTKYVLIDKNDSAIFLRFKAVQKAKEIITNSQALYAIGDPVVKKYFEDIKISKFLSSHYEF